MAEKSSTLGSIWVSTSILRWRTYVESRECLENGLSLKRSYEIWGYADRLVEYPRHDEDRSTAIIQLKRAIEIRDTILDELFTFKAIPGASVIKKQFPKEKEFKREIMVALGLMRPAMKEYLRNLRNCLVHGSDLTAPDTETCRRLSDFTWYYLRSTDFIAAQPITDIVLSEEPPPYRYYPEIHARLSLKRDPWQVKVNGMIPAALASETQADNSFRVDGSISGPDTDGLYMIDGELKGPDEAALKIMNLCFFVVS